MVYKLSISLLEMNTSRLEQRAFIALKKELFAEKHKCDVEEIEVVIVGQQKLRSVK